MIGVFYMAKYDYDFKLKVVKSYLNGEGEYITLAKQYGIPAHSQVEQWVNAYNTFGIDGLRRKNTHTSYTVQFKLDVINYMITNKSSAQEVANHFGVNNISLVTTRKLKYLNGGVNALSKMRGKPPMNKKINKEKNLTREQELERENELLKAELAFLKSYVLQG